jgi:hypothetical protein
MMVKRLLIVGYGACWMIAGAVFASPISMAVTMCFPNPKAVFVPIYLGTIAVGGVGGLLFSRWSISWRRLQVTCLIGGAIMAVICCSFIVLFYPNPNTAAPAIIITGASTIAAIGSLLGMRKHPASGLPFWCLITLITDLIAGAWLAIALTSLKRLEGLIVPLILMTLGPTWILSVDLILAGLFGSLYRNYQGAESIA